jgi:predicted PurR-regulated permease PerM
MEPPPLIEAAPTPPPAFMERVRHAAYAIILIVLAIHLLREFRAMLQPLFVALFLTFLMHPIHRWLVQRGIPSLVGYGIILSGVALGFFAFGSIMVANVAELARDQAKLKQYEARLNSIVRDIADRLPMKKVDEPDEQKPPPLPGDKTAKSPDAIWDRLLPPGWFINPALSVFAQVQESIAWSALVFLFILFLIAEKVSFPERLALAFGPTQGARVMSIVESINLAIGQYVAVKTLVSALAGLMSYTVLVVFEVELAASWALLIFLLNYIPYVGSLIACALPIILSFLQFPSDMIWKPIVITTLLIAIQQFIGNWIEPRMAGQRLDVSPLLIVLSLAFWWTVWGVFGAILAVPLLVIVKIILDNIPETKPIATLISNR